jgi:hypothetical protein
MMDLFSCVGIRFVSSLFFLELILPLSVLFRYMPSEYPIGIGKLALFSYMLCILVLLFDRCNFLLGM